MKQRPQRSPARVAGVLVPALPAAAQLRAHLELAQSPLAVVSEPGSRATVLSVSPAAAHAGEAAIHLDASGLGQIVASETIPNPVMLRAITQPYVISARPRSDAARSQPTSALSRMPAPGEPRVLDHQALVLHHLHTR